MEPSDADGSGSPSSSMDGSTGGVQPSSPAGSARAPRRGSDYTQLRQSELRTENAEALGLSDSGKAKRRARWSRDPTAGRIARVEELERQLAQSQALEFDDDDSEESGASRGSPSWCERRSSVAFDQPRDTSGFLMKKSGAFSGTKKRFFVLNGGTLLWYKSETDKSPTGYLHLSECLTMSEYSAMSSPRSKNADLAADSNAVLVLKASKEYMLWAEDESDRDKWLRCLRHNRTFPPLPQLCGAVAAATPRNVLEIARDRAAEGVDRSQSDLQASLALAGRSSDIKLEGDPRATHPPATKESAKAQKRSMLSNLALRAEKKMVGRAVTSDLGKKILREYCLPETFTLLQAMRDLASGESQRAHARAMTSSPGKCPACILPTDAPTHRIDRTVDPAMPPKTGQKIEDTILKMAVKVVLLFQHGRLTARDFDPVVRLVDELCIDIVRKYDCVLPPPHVDTLDREHANYGRMMKRLDQYIGSLLQVHISQKNIVALSEVVSYLGSPANLHRFMGEPKCKAEIGKVADALRHMYGL